MPPEASIATLSQLCATKFRVAQPDSFGLFLYKEQGYHRLPAGALAHGLPPTGYLVYRRAEWPEAQEPGTGQPGAGSEEEGRRDTGSGDKDKARSREAGITDHQAEGQAGGGPRQPGESGEVESQVAEE